MTVPNELDLRHRPDGAVLVGPPPAGPAGTSIVSIPGGHVVVDPADPDGPLHAVLEEPGAALPAVVALFGAAAADAVAAGAADGRPVPVRPGPLDPAVRRLGLCRWLAHHSPDALPDALLDVEWGMAGTAAELSDETADEAARRLAARADDVVALARLLREPGLPPAPAGLPELVALAVEAVAEAVPLGDPIRSELVHEQELTAALRHFGVADDARSWADLAALPGVGGRELEGAVDAGSGPAVGEQRGSVDWFQVPREVLDTAEDTLRWYVRDDELEVSVRAAATGMDYAGLAFRVFAAGALLPVARSALRRTPDGRWFTGRVGLQSDLAGAGPLVVDVYDTGSPRPARLGIAAVAARAVRWSTRAITLLRLGAGHPGSDAVAAEALRVAQGLHEQVAAEHPDADHRAWARRREARCAALRRGALIRGGRPRPAAAIGRRWERPVEPVTAFDVAVPDLGGPGWQPLVAERALLEAPAWRR